MTSSDGGSSRDPIDPDFAALFRPEDVVPSIPRTPEPPDDDEPHFEPVMDPVLDPRAEEAAHVADALEHPEPPAPAASVVAADPVADTGRLFRSQGVTSHSEAVLALSVDRSGRLRTLDRQQEASAAPVLADVGPLVDGADIAPGATGVEAVVITSAAAPEEADVNGPASSGRGRRRRDRPAGPGFRARRITAGAVYIVVIGVTVLVGFANALLSDGDIGWPTGLALVVSSVYAALTVRREDDIVAIIVPPIAFLAAAMTAGQLFLGSAEGSILNRAVIVFFTLADNWVWVIGATVAALVIVLVRRRRG